MPRTAVPFAARIVSIACVAALANLVAVDARAADKAPHAKPSRVTAADAAHDYGRRPDVRAFVDELAAEQGFAKGDLLQWFAAARYQPKIVAAMERPIVAPPKWFEYAPQFLSAERIDGGVNYLRAHEVELLRAERDYGVPPEIIVAVIGVETYYGRNLGSYRIFDALTTLAFDYPRRAPFFKAELKEFLRLAREQRMSPLAPKGSFAGAMGVPQFMPSSYRRYAVDFDGDGHVDLWTSTPDIVGSVANYLARHDWAPGEPVLLPAAIDDDARDGAMAKLDGGLSERRELDAWMADGVSPDALPSQWPAGQVGLLMLEQAPVGGEDRVTFWIACPNFYVITRYNRSRLYASAVFELAQAIRRAHDATLERR